MAKKLHEVQRICDALQIQVESLANRLGIFERDALRWQYLVNHTNDVLMEYTGNLDTPSFTEVVDRRLAKRKKS